MTEMLTTIFISTIVTIFGAIVYGLLFGQREDKIRNYLKRKKTGWIRKKYVNAFVGGVRGRAGAMDTWLLSMLILLVVSGVFLFLDGAYKYLDFKTKSNLDKAYELKQDFEDKINKTINKNTNRLEEYRIRMRINTSIASSEKIDAEIRWFLVQLKVIYWALIIYIVYGVFLWQPFIVLRKRFSIEMERFALRIQGLASKSELAEFAVLESEVNDEATLKKFVEHTKLIANRHNVPKL